MGQCKNSILTTVKAYFALFFISMFVIYLIFGFVAWGWNMGDWFWSIRLMHVACSAYIAHYYHQLLIIIFSDETEYDSNFFYEASKRNND